MPMTLMRPAISRAIVRTEGYRRDLPTDHPLEIAVPHPGLRPLDTAQPRVREHIESQRVAGVYVALLGGFRLTVAGVSVEIPGRKSRALLAYLAGAPGIHQRDKL